MPTIPEYATTKCLCREWCGDADAEMPEEGDEICKGLPYRSQPLVEIVLEKR